MRLVSAALRCRRSGLILRRSSLKFFAMLLLLVPRLSAQQLEVFIVDAVGDRDHLLVKPIVPRLTASDEQDCHSSWVEGVEDPVRVTTHLNSQLSYVPVLGALHVRA